MQTPYPYPSVETETVGSILHFLSTVDAKHMAFTVAILFLLLIALFFVRDIYTRRSAKKQHADLFSIARSVYRSTNGIKEDGSHEYESLPEILSALNKRTEQVHANLMLNRKCLKQMERTLLLIEDRLRR